jgi:hypothetical protein
VLLGGTQDNGGQRYLGHPAWRIVTHGDGPFTAIEPKMPREWYIGMNSAGIVHFGAGDHKEWGRFFHTANDGLPAFDVFSSFIACDPSNTGTLFFAYITNEDPGVSVVYWSHGADGHGHKWEKIEATDDGNDASDITALAVAPSDANVVYFARDSRALFRLDLVSGAWKQTVVGGTMPLTTSSWKQIAVDPTNANVFYAVLGGIDGPPGDKPTPPNRIFRGTLAGLTPLAPLPDVVFPSLTIDGDTNVVNAIVIDPAHTQTMFVGTQHGVFRTDDGGGTWAPFGVGLPRAALVTSLQLHSASRRLRAGTLGRSVWEIALDEPDRAVDLFLRDSVIDIGRADAAQPTLESGAHPFEPAVNIAWTDGIDIKLDTERRFIGGFESLGSVNYDGVAVDYLGFEELEGDDPRSGAQSRVYVQVHNRGPNRASGVRVRVYFAKKGTSGYPDLPAQFWNSAPGDGPDTGTWKPLGPAITIDDLAPGEPRIARFEWTAHGADDTVGLLAVITSPDDPVPTTLPLAVETAVRADKHVALKEVTIATPSYAIVLLTLAILGVVAGGIILAEES